MNMTDAQKRAIDARGNVLVAAGAGTGKTRTLVERCLSCLLDEKAPASIDEILMVTFTEAAAAEMRRRIRDRLEQQKQACPESPYWQEQLALFESAHIGTLHSFCLRLVRQHFYELGLDPQLAVLAEEEAILLAEETLDQMLQRHYAADDAPARAVQNLIRAKGGGGDLPIRNLVLQLYHYTQTLPDPGAWGSQQLTHFGSAEPSVWQGWLDAAIKDLSRRWLPVIEAVAGDNKVAAQCRVGLRELADVTSGAELTVALKRISAAREASPHGKKALWVEPLRDLFSEGAFLASLISFPGEIDPLAQDWMWVRDQMTALLELAREFSEAFTEAKRELALLDFHDLEQFCLRLLWDSKRGEPTPIALGWRDKLRFVFVDEYQDINAAQDKIIECLARESARANRFLVGDVKQSIYRFRLANPAIFQRYAAQWAAPKGEVIALVENFRSREGLLRCINSIFELLLTPDLGGVDYRNGSALEFGAPAERAQFRADNDRVPPVELHLLIKEATADAIQTEDPSEPEFNPIGDLLDAEKEARLIVVRLRQLRLEKFPVWDQKLGAVRPIVWGDMAILLRAPSRKAESYVKEFARLNVPLQLARTGFYDCLEVLDLLSLLQLLDNPLQDIPALAVLRSPLVGLTLAELAEIRIALPKGPFWTALIRWRDNHTSSSDLESSAGNGVSVTGSINGDVDPQQKIGTFLARFSRWRHMAQQTSLSRCLETVLNETHYDSWIMTQPNGLQRQANLERLIGVARQFDQFQRQGLFRFLKYVEAQKSSRSEPEPPALHNQDAVRLMSIHQSKGLEFPLVVVADLGKKFNTAELRAEVILDEAYGLCPLVKPPTTGKRYPSLAHWLGSRRQLHELLGEELRLLYVATTRARDLLLLTGTITKSKLAKASGATRGAASTPANARTYLDWLLQWFQTIVAPGTELAEHGQTDLLRWFLHHPSTLAQPEQEAFKLQSPVSVTPGPDAVAAQELERRLSWKYPFVNATRQPAKTSVTALRRQAAAEKDEAVFLTVERAGWGPGRVARAPGDLDSAETGKAHHLFLQFVSLERSATLEWFRCELERLVDAGRLTQEQARSLVLADLVDFWNSELGGRIRERARFVHRELGFTARFSPEQLVPFGSQFRREAVGSEFVLVQGVADLVVISPEEIWLLDFKTDQVDKKDLHARVAAYRPQIELYALALSRIYRRPVTQSWFHFIGLRQSVAVPMNG